MKVVFTVRSRRCPMMVACALAAALALSAPSSDAGNAKPVEDEIAAVEREAFSIAFKPVKALVGRSAAVTVAVKSKGVFHLNQQYPHRLVLDEVPEGVRVAKREFLRADASLEERSLTFTIGVTPEKAGRHPIRALLKTSVCDDAQCILKSERITLRVTGK